MTPALPIREVHVRPPDLSRTDEPIVTLERDSAGVWWHGVAGKHLRRATVLETLLPLAPSSWRRLGIPAPEVHDAS